jgi:hypothetical protein
MGAALLAAAKVLLHWSDMAAGRALAEQFCRRRSRNGGQWAAWHTTALRCVPLLKRRAKTRGRPLVLRHTLCGVGMVGEPSRILCGRPALTVVEDGSSDGTVTANQRKEMSSATVPLGGMRAMKVRAGLGRRLLRFVRVPAGTTVNQRNFPSASQPPTQHPSPPVLPRVQEHGGDRARHVRDAERLGSAFRASAPWPPRLAGMVCRSEFFVHPRSL